jgi:hypothetical protein
MAYYQNASADGIYCSESDVYTGMMCLGSLKADDFMEMTGILLFSGWC